MLFPDLKDVLGDRHFLEVSYYFAPNSDGNIQISLYCDHKIADTFNTTLTSGPILPYNLGYESLKEHNIYNLALGLFDSNEPYKISEEKRIIHINLINSIHEYDKQSLDLIPDDKSVWLAELQFMPFITNCRAPDINIISKVTYYNFISGNITKDEENYYRKHYPNYDDIYEYIYSLQNSEITCILPFYKSGKYAMT